MTKTNDNNLIIEDSQDIVDDVLDEEYGDTTVSGSSPSTDSDDDVAGMVEEVIGNEPVSGKPFSLADQMERDERAQWDIPPDEAKVPGKNEE